jgi:hypothetical protein
MRFMECMMRVAPYQSAEVIQLADGSWEPSEESSLSFLYHGFEDHLMWSHRTAARINGPLWDGWILRDQFTELAKASCGPNN